jgi:hypothetical protein
MFFFFNWKKQQWGQGCAGRRGLCPASLRLGWRVFFAGSTTDTQKSIGSSVPQSGVTGCLRALPSCSILEACREGGYQPWVTDRAQDQRGATSCLQLHGLPNIPDLFLDTVSLCPGPGVQIPKVQAWLCS